MVWWKKADSSRTDGTAGPGGADPETGRAEARPEALLERLATASTLAFGGVGIASTTLPETDAYLTLGRHVDGPASVELRRGLERLLDRATPAGKVYAADLLARIDPAAGRQAWERLASDPAEVSTFTGCVMGRTTLAEYAGNRLSAA